LFVDEQALSEVPAEIMTGDFPKVLVAGFLGSSIGRPSDHGSDAWLFQIDNGVFRGNIVFPLVAAKITLDIVGQVGITKLSPTTSGVFPRGFSGILMESPSYTRGVQGTNAGCHTHH
jgi:hypothetical protein